MNLESVTWSKIEARASLGGPGEAWWVGVVGGAQPHHWRMATIPH